MASMPNTMRITNSDDDEGPISPEALLISAYLEQGLFTPLIHHVTDEDIGAWARLWSYCQDYQNQAMTSPPLSLIFKQFPDFEYTPGVNPSWAAAMVRASAGRRRLRTSIKASLDALGQEDLEGAYSALSGLQRPRGQRRDPVNVFDQATVVDEFAVSKILVPWPSLGRATGGIGPGEFWLLAARLGQGKSWLLGCFAACAAMAGYRVAIHSLEMPAIQVARRCHQLLAGNDHKLLLQLRSTELDQHKQALERIQANTPGTIDVLDPSHGRINTTASVSESCHEYDLVMVDHVGLLVSPDGHRAVEDWRHMAIASNILREITLASGTPVLGASQVNRTGENSSGAPPKTSQLSQADSLGQDADVIITMRRLSKSVMVQSAEKVRNGPNLRWYNHFDPAKNRFDEVSKDVAAELSMLDEDALTI